MLKRELNFPPVGSFAWAHALLLEHGKVSAEETVVLIKRNFSQDQVAWITKALSRRKRGRKLTRHPAQMDFHPAFPKMLRDFRKKFAEFKTTDATRRAEVRAAGGKLPRAEETPAENAWAYVFAKYGPVLGIRRLETLRNVVSRTFRKLPDCPPELEEIEAAWFSQESEPNFGDGSRSPTSIQTHVKKRKDAK